MTRFGFLARWPAVLVATLLPLAPVHAESFSGSYLGARQAEREGNVATAARLYAETVALDPQNPELLERAMFFKIAAGDVPGALPFAQALVQADPENRYLPLILVTESVRAGAFGDALKHLSGKEEALGNLLHALLKAWVESVDDTTSADLTLDSLTGNETTAAFAGYHKALIHAVAGDLEGAATLFEARGEDFLSGDRRALIAMSEVFAATGRQAKALALLDTVLARGRDAGLSTLRERIAVGEAVQVALIPNATEGVAEALHSFAAVLASGEQNRNFAILLSRLSLHLRPDLTEAKLLVAGLLEDEGQFDLAIAAFATVPPGSPLFVRAETGRAGALAAAGRLEEAIGVLTGLTRSHPTELIPVTALGDVLRRVERFAEAAAAYGTAIGLVPEVQARHWVLFYQRGQCHERTGNWPAAEADFRRALELEPDQPLVLNYLGYSLVEMGQKMPEAEDMIRRAVAQRPDDGFITDSLAWVLYRLGRYEEAVAPMERAVELEPSDPILNDHLGDILWKVGRKLEARFQWKRALSFDPEEKDRTRIRAKLETGLDAVLEAEKAPAPTATPPAAPVKTGNDG